MKRICIFVISFGIWACVAFAGTVFAAEDPLSAAGIRKFKTKLNAPDFVLEDVSGNRKNLLDYQGQIVLLSFLTTW